MKKSKKAPPARDDSAAQAASKLRADSVRVYERLLSHAFKDDIIDGFWTVHRDRQEKQLNQVNTSVSQRESWPEPSMPTTGMLPSAGFAPSQLAGRKGTVLMVAAFGVSEARLDSILEQIRDWQRAQPQHRPVFFTDCPHHKGLRHSGYNFEYFPTHIYGGEDHVGLFNQRFQMLRHKWNAASFLDLGVPSFLRRRLDNEYEDLLQIQPGTSKGYNPRRSKPKT